MPLKKEEHRYQICEHQLNKYNLRNVYNHFACKHGFYGQK